MAIVTTLTPTFRVAFPNIFEVSKMSGKFGLTMLFNMEAIKSNPDQVILFKGMKELVKDAQIDKWKSVDDVPDHYESPFKDGADKSDYQGYGEGVIFINATSKYQPGLVDQKKQDIIDPSKFYGGCHARATINAYAWGYMGKAGVSFGIQNIQLVKDDEPFGGRSTPEKDFDALEVENEGSEAVTTDLFGDL